MQLGSSLGEEVAMTISGDCICMMERQFSSEMSFVTETLEEKNET
jgi:hypothetical protein